MKSNSDEFSFPLTRRPTTVFETIIDNFKRALIQGQLHPGQKLPSELELAEQMGVGRTAVREAMKFMAALGVVNIRQGDGTYVVDKPSPQLFSPLVFALMLEARVSRELYELRTMLQIAYTQLAAQNMNEEDWQRIQEAARALEEYVQGQTPDPDEQTQLDLKFHYTILDATHNALVIRIGRTVEELFFVSIRNTQISNPKTAVDGHRRIMEALQQRNMEAIRDTVVATLAYWRESMEQEE